MTSITLTQGAVTAPLIDVYFSPASAHFENGTAYAIDSSISASSNVIFGNGPAELSFDDQNFIVMVTVLEFDEEEDDVDDVEGENPACHLMIDSENLKLEKLADLLELGS